MGSEMCIRDRVNSGEEYAGQAAGFIDQMLSILYGLLALAVIIAVLGIVNTLTLGVIERRQEIGMLRAVGTQRRQIRTMITLESVQIALFGAVMGILIGLGLGWSFIEILGDEGLDSAQIPVSYTHLRAHETPEHLVCRLLLEKKKIIKP